MLTIGVVKSGVLSHDKSYHCSADTDSGVNGIVLLQGGLIMRAGVTSCCGTRGEYTQSRLIVDKSSSHKPGIFRQQCSLTPPALSGK